MPLNNYIVKEFLRSDSNPRNSEGAFIDLADGRIMYIYSKFNSGIGSDHDPADLASIFSRDCGETWSESKTVITAADDTAQNIMSVSLLRMQNNDIGMFYFIRHGFDNGKAYLRRSCDEGQTWSESSSCVPAYGYYVTNNDRVVRLRNGRLVLPAAFHRAFLNKVNASLPIDVRGVSIYFYSDDDGLTWQESNLCCMNSRYSCTGLQEPGLIELNNGSLYGWARTDMGCQYEMFSNDSGATWSTPEPSLFTGPDSPLCIKRSPIGGNLLAVWNPIPNYQTRVYTDINDRNPLVYAVSRNDGTTWETPVTIEDDPLSGYCYTSIHFTGDSVLLAYCAGNTNDNGCLNRLRIRKLKNPCL